MKRYIGGVLVLLISLVVVQLAAAAIVDEFNSATLNTSLWDVKIVGDATATIASGVLTLASPAVESGVILYYPVNVEDLDISIEVKFDTSAMVENISIGCIADLMPPQLNTDINNNWEATFFVTPANWYLKQDPVNIGEKPPNPGILGPYTPGWNVVKVENSETNGKIIFYLSGEEVGSVDKNPDVVSRYFFISCDPYTSHYTGAMAIDYIKLDGPGLATAVKPAGKVASTWGSMKSSY